MFNLRRMLVWIIALTLSVASFGTVLAQDSGRIRFVHVVPNAASVDLYVNGTLAISELSYGNSTNYLNAPTGNHTLTVTTAGQSTVLWEQSITVDNNATTFIASEAGAFSPFSDNVSATNIGNSRLLLVHALAGGESVNVALAEDAPAVSATAGTVIAEGMAYGTSFGAFDLPAATYVVDVIAAGDAVVLDNISLSLATGTSYIAVVYGTNTNPEVLLLSAAVTAGADAGFVRVVHGVAGAPAVDVYLNDALAIPGLSITRPTEHIAIPAGTYAAVVTVAGSDEVVAEGEFTVEAGAASTVVAVATADGIALSVFSDDISGVDASNAGISVINTVPDSSVAVDLTSGTTVASDIAFGASSSTTTVAPTTASVAFTLTINDVQGSLVGNDMPFYGGVYYSLIVLDAEAGNPFSVPSVLVASTALAQDLNSAPDAGVSITTQVETAPDPVQPQATQAAPSGIPTDAVTALVVLDPSANLQLRQYPSAEALSLGLAPSGSTLVVNGREGRPVALVEGQEPPPEAEEWVDPVTLLENEDDDLDPQETWLNITYSTPDGGEIRAWVLSQFLVVRDPDGNLQRLADLPTIGGNIAGEAVNTAITPPAPPENVLIASVININTTANLNVRRTPETVGEVLTQLPLNTVVEVIGLIDSEVGELFDPELAEWTFISYAPAEGGVITGWVSTSFLDFEFNDRRITLTEALERELIEAIDAETRGEVSATARTSIATPDPQRNVYVGEVILDANANLQFRRFPDAQAESLGLIPSGTLLVIEGRTLLGDWLLTTFEGESGWISSQYLYITYNGESQEIVEIPVVEAENPLDTNPVVEPTVAPVVEPTAEPTAEAESGG